MRRLPALVMALLAAACTSSSGPEEVVPGDGDAAALLGSGCIGSPGETCAPYPDGTSCPGPPMVCVACAPGVYTPSDSNCLCTSGSWVCTPPAAGEIQCSSPVGNYTDPYCSIAYGQEAGVTDAATSTSGDASLPDVHVAEASDGAARGDAGAADAERTDAAADAKGDAAP